jgi:hypothetical protein
MSNHLKNNAVGLDKELNNLQEWLYDTLLSEFSWTDYECYGRAYLNSNPREAGKYIFELPIDGKDYKDIMMDDTHAVSSFFYKKSLNNGELAEATVVLFFNINLKKLLGQSATRMDEDAIMDILNVINDNPVTSKTGAVKTTTKEVYSEFNINFQDRDNMSDFMVCSIELTITYQTNYC